MSGLPMSSETRRSLRIAKDFSLPSDAVTQTFAILAKRGAGKTYTASVLFEEMIDAGAPAIVIDPVGVWWGVRAAGPSPGLDVTVVGGSHGDVEIDEKMGEAIASFVVDTNAPLVIDLSLFRKAAMVRFMTDFAEALYRLKATARSPLHIFVDEADAFAPQRPMPGQQRLLGAMEDLVRRGRARGIGLTLISQRPAVLNKNVLTQTECLVVLRMTAPQDHKAIDAWIQEHGDSEKRVAMMSSLASLPTGDAWFWSPSWLDVFRRVHVRARRTFDSSATPDASPSIAATKAPAVATTIERLRACLAPPSPPPTKKQSPRALPPSPPPRAPSSLPQLTRQDLDREILAAARIMVATLRSEMQAEFDALFTRCMARVRALGSVNASAEGDGPVAELVPDQLFRNAESASKSARNGAVWAPRDTGEPNTLRLGERKMLGVLASFADGMTLQALATLSGFVVTGGTFRAYLGTLKRSGLAEVSPDRVVATPSGLTLAGSPSRPEAREVIEMWRSRLRRGERAMFDELFGYYPKSLSPEDLAQAIGFEVRGGTFRAYLGTLRRNGLISIHSDKTISLASELAAGGPS